MSAKDNAFNATHITRSIGPNEIERLHNAIHMLVHIGSVEQFVLANLAQLALE